MYLPHPRKLNLRSEFLRIVESNIGTMVLERRVLSVAKRSQLERYVVDEKSPTLEHANMTVLVSRQNVRRLS